MFSKELLKKFVTEALAEDIGPGDYSSIASIPEGARGSAKLLVKDSGILAGIEVAREIYALTDPTLEIDWKLRDGDRVKHGDIGFVVTGSMHTILKTERLVLNLMQRLSGIATATNRMVKLTEGTSCKILDTRKTTPHMRFLEKWAVTVGGGYNHRIGLYDMIMLKDNHVDAAGGIEKAIESTRSFLAENSLNLKVEIEVRSLAELDRVLAKGGIDRIMLDNFSIPDLEKAVKLIDRSYETEASGGITEDTLRSYALTGVDFISVGAITHSVKALDISLKVTSV